MLKINLLAERKQLKTRAPKVAKIETGGNAGQSLLLGAILLFAVAATGGWWYMLSGEVKSLKSQHTEADAELARLAEVRKKGDQYKNRKALLTRKIDLITDLKKKQAVPVHILDQVSKNLPSFLWLESLTSTGDSITISGKATNYNSVSLFYNNLTEVGHFQNVELGRTYEVPEGVAFSLKCAFIAPGQATSDDASDEDVS